MADENHESLLKTIGERWRNEKNFDRAPLLNKYQKILLIAEKSPFDENEQAFANLRFLIGIRNHLMHYKREWAVMNSLIFTNEFFRRLELPAPYEGIRNELGTR
jgi:hypothetical protein